MMGVGLAEARSQMNAAKSQEAFLRRKKLIDLFGQRFGANFIGLDKFNRPIIWGKTNIPAVKRAHA